ncbi:Ent-kaurene synthase [Medicago truncatula]|uniref:ent-kaurene synthase n=1 Tax=Medicago truncatula TaxID=3880 RepID=A0A072UW13_MEDTR|nr:Ent-kaurene synthase [Medicago truncatula]
MSLPHFSTHLPCFSSTSALKKKNNSTTALCFEDTKERIKNIFKKVELSISSYDTAWVAMIPSSTSPHAPFFPQCLNWLLDNQLVDGSWGLPDRHPLLMNDSLLSTLACILALKQWNIAEDKINKGLEFIESNFTSIIDDQQQHPIGFDILFPSLIEYAHSLGINIAIRSTTLEAIIQKRDRELKRGFECNSEGWKAYLAYVSEGMLNSMDFNTIIKYQRKNGSLFNSPATTAAVFQHSNNADCLSYLQSVLQKFGNAVPTVYPLDIYGRLYMIDSLERLGIDRHFEKEIQSVLDETYRYWLQEEEDIFLDPTTCAMAFRILRLNGYDVSSDPFYQYSEDKFANSLKGYLKDVSAVLELYKASQVIIHPDESVLFKQSSWTRHFLEQDSSTYQLYADKLRIYVDNEVNEVLNFPQHKNLERMLNRRSVEHYNANETRILKTSYRSCNLASKEILKLAVGDFNLCQSIHNQELKQLEGWIVENRLDKLKFARQKQAYCYFIGAATLFSPELSDSRLALAKSTVLVTVVDDFFDVGSSEEEQLNIIQLFKIWDVDVDTVCCSEAVKIIFSAMRSTICEFGEKSVKRQGRNVTENLIKIWSNMIQSMFIEAEWSRSKTIPTIDVYMENACETFGLEPLILTALYLLGPKLSDDVATNKELNYILKTTSICGRLLNDIQTFKREFEQGKLNAVTLHMVHGNGVVTVEDAIDKLKSVVEENRMELLRLVLQEKGSLVPRPCKDVFWKMMKASYLFYDENDKFTLNEMYSTVNAVIKDPIFLNELLGDSKKHTLSKALVV